MAHPASRLRYLLFPSTWGTVMARYAKRASLVARRLMGRIHQAPIESADRIPVSIRDELVAFTELETRPPSLFSEPTSYGGLYQRERIRTVASYCVKTYPGDIVEIGCYLGETTRILAGIAAAHGRRVIAVDPWQTGTQNCSGSEYERFCENTREHKEFIDIFRMSSLSAEAIADLKARPLCMAWVDGLHTYEAALSDIRTVGHRKGIIAVDDVSYGCEVMMAMRQGALDLGRKAVYLRSAREGYLV